jgi:hypothetical protein
MYPNWQNLAVIIRSKDADPTAQARAMEQVFHLAHTGDREDALWAVSFLPGDYDASGRCPCSGCSNQRLILAVPDAPIGRPSTENERPLPEWLAV